MKKYIYVGGGDGIPGLPHQITDQEAAAEGLTELLNSAIESGAYIEQADEKPARKKEK